jgi:class 3 adenylate cyclase
VAQLIRESTTGPVCSQIIDAIFETTDVTARLGGIKVPTLVFHRMEQQLVKAAEGRRLAAEIPDAQFVPLGGDRLWIGADEEDAVYGVIDEFLAPASPAAVGPPAPALLPNAGLCAVLFTDVVGHTAIMSRLGDRRGREVLREHEVISRQTLAEFSGFEVKAMGDGFMASFASVASAMDCAVTLQRRFADRNESATEPLHIRIGLNAGEPILEDGDLFGAMVITAARVAAKADAGEILIPDPVRHLLAGKDFVFADRGETLLKGFEDAVRLYEVSWKL